MNKCRSIIPSRTFAQNVIPIKSTALSKISCKRAGKAFLVKPKNKMLLQTIRILKMQGLLRDKKYSESHANQINKLLLYI